jgi:hypothetical protein
MQKTVNTRKVGTNHQLMVSDSKHKSEIIPNKITNKIRLELTGEYYGTRHN